MLLSTKIRAEVVLVCGVSTAVLDILPETVELEADPAVPPMRVAVCAVLLPVVLTTVGSAPMKP